MKFQRRVKPTGSVRIKLISMPWPLFNRPSIQLGTLKAYLEKKAPEITVDCAHPYLEIAANLGPELYHWISRNPWVSEALYAPVLFPEQTGPAEMMVQKLVRKADKDIRTTFRYKDLVQKVSQHLPAWVERENWSEYSLVGFSVCFHQLLASLAAAAAVKKKHPGVAIVFGGSACTGTAAQSLLNAFDCIDFIIQGEGEKGLLELCCNIDNLATNTLPANIVTRKSAESGKSRIGSQADTGQLAAIDVLPIPSYDDYFSEKIKWFPDNPFIPVLPLEFSRGCWWDKCSFCNLNLQWCGFRHKQTAQMLNEVKILASRHKCLDFSFVDNMLPPEEALEFFRQTAEKRSDYNFFAEIRSAKSKIPQAELFAVYRQGGLTSIQVGIEALSSSLLKKMRKGLSTIDNIAAMRDAQEAGLKLEGNLIVEFPGSSPSEVAETLENLDYVFPYPPLTTASFFLGFGSPVYKNPQNFGITSIVNHPNNNKLFPESILTKINLLVQDYRGGRASQQKIWRPVRNKVKLWQQYHAKHNHGIFGKPLLSYRDGDNFLLVRQVLPDGKVLHHKLTGSSRQIYLCCTRIRAAAELFTKFPEIPPEKIIGFLNDLKNKRIIFSEKDKYLALAVHYRK